MGKQPKRSLPEDGANRSLVLIASVTLVFVFLFWLLLPRPNRSSSTDNNADSTVAIDKGSGLVKNQAKTQPENGPVASKDRSPQNADSVDAQDADSKTARELGISVLELWEKRLARAQETLDSYLESTKYPPNSRPISEKPDMKEPHHDGALTAKHGLGGVDKTKRQARVTVQQDRFYMLASETALLGLECELDGPQICQFDKVVVEAVQAKQPIVSTISFNDDGKDGDIEKGDNMYTAKLKPSDLGFSTYLGLIRTTAWVTIGSEKGFVSWDIMSTPQTPADFSGTIREVMQNGSLDLFIGMKVTKPGRYILHVRVDDSSGKSFAFLTFNDLLDSGNQEAKVTIFGKLVIDQQAQPPFKLRDLEGYLLKENVDPDRELMSAKLGVIYTTKPYRKNEFTDAAWESEEKDRHVKEFTKDVNKAKEKVEELGEK